MSLKALRYYCFASALLFACLQVHAQNLHILEDRPSQLFGVGVPALLSALFLGMLLWRQRSRRFAAMVIIGYPIFVGICVSAIQSGKNDLSLLWFALLFASPWLLAVVLAASVISFKSWKSNAGP
jgi:hypothetical protein